MIGANKKEIEDDVINPEIPVITNKINHEGLVNSPVDRLNKKEIVDDEINP